MYCWVSNFAPRRMILLSGASNVEITFTGLREGEKLYEELLMDEEGLEATANNLIHIGKPIDINEDDFFAGLEELSEIMYDDNAEKSTRIRYI